VRSVDRGGGINRLVRVGRFSAYVLSMPVGNTDLSPDHLPLWFTDNGGQSWSRRQVPCGLEGWSAVLSAAPDGTLIAVCAGEPTAGYQAKATSLSTDGGLTWSVHPTCEAQTQDCNDVPVLPVDDGYLGAVDAVSGTTAFLIGSRSALLTTHDGGADWQSAGSQVGDGDGGPSQMTFSNDANGVVLGDGALWRTTDGGTNWSKVVPKTI
jgi:photosystem II stability/assembly factor-like uncharacterized protein